MAIAPNVLHAPSHPPEEHFRHEPTFPNRSRTCPAIRVEIAVCAADVSPYEGRSDSHISALGGAPPGAIRAPCLRYRARPRRYGVHGRRKGLADASTHYQHPRHRPQVLVHPGCCDHPRLADTTPESPTGPVESTIRGGGVIRTREGRFRPLTAFEAVPFVHSGTPPWGV